MSGTGADIKKLASELTEIFEAEQLLGGAEGATIMELAEEWGATRSMTRSRLGVLRRKGAVVQGRGRRRRQTDNQVFTVPVYRMATPEEREAINAGTADKELVAIPQATQGGKVKDGRSPHRKRVRVRKGKGEGVSGAKG